jgi:hypothetical protein
MIRSRLFPALALVLASVACAPQGDEVNPAPAGEENVAVDDLRTPLSDAALQGKLKGILKDVSFTSESDYPYVVIEGDAAEVPANRDDEDFTYAHHDKQVMIALKTMRAQLRSVVGYTFGTNESGDMDEVGTVLYVYVGISKTTGKLIAIMTEAVYT